MLAWQPSVGRLAEDHFHASSSTSSGELRNRPDGDAADGDDLRLHDDPHHHAHNDDPLVHDGAVPHDVLRGASHDVAHSDGAPFHDVGSGEAPHDVVLADDGASPNDPQCKPDVLQQVADDGAADVGASGRMSMD